MSAETLRESQLNMARYLRDPRRAAAPEGIEPRRMKIYLELIYNNVEGFISGGFPVLHSLYEQADWEQLVRAFLKAHRCRSPYFLEISQEFIDYLMKEHVSRTCDPPFMAELAHYEWVELALDVSQECVPEAQEVTDISEAVLQLSPTAWLLSYQYPVHKIGSSFRPESSEQPTYLVVYRNREDEVKFLELNSATARLLELVRDNDGQHADALLRELAAEMDAEYTAIVNFGCQQLSQFLQQAVVVAE